MVKEGLLASDSPRGTWDITETGKRLLRQLMALRQCSLYATVRLLCFLQFSDPPVQFRQLRQQLPLRFLFHPEYLLE